MPLRAVLAVVHPLSFYPLYLSLCLSSSLSLVLCLSSSVPHAPSLVLCLSSSVSSPSSDHLSLSFSLSHLQTNVLIVVSQGMDRAVRGIDDGTLAQEIQRVSVPDSLLPCCAIASYVLCRLSHPLSFSTSLSLIICLSRHMSLSSSPFVSHPLSLVLCLSSSPARILVSLSYFTAATKSCPYRRVAGNGQSRSRDRRRHARSRDPESECARLTIALLCHCFVRTLSSLSSSIFFNLSISHHLPLSSSISVSHHLPLSLIHLSSTVSHPVPHPHPRDRILCLCHTPLHQRLSLSLCRRK